MPARPPLLLLLVVAASGCTRYGFGDRAPDGPDARGDVDGERDTTAGGPEVPVGPADRGPERGPIDAALADRQPADLAPGDSAPSDVAPPDAALPVSVAQRSYPPRTLIGGDRWHAPEVWDLRGCALRSFCGCDLAVRYAVNLSGATQSAPNEPFWAEVGLRQEGGADFNPTGLGAWIVSMTMNLTPSPGAETKHDKHSVQHTAAQDERAYDVADCATDAIGTPIGNLSGSFGLYFDRDSTDAAHMAHPLAGAGKTYETKGRYEIELCYRATSGDIGVLCQQVNGVAPGFYDNGWAAQLPDTYPAGLGFVADLSRMQVFVGTEAGSGAGGSVDVEPLSVLGCLRATP